MHEYFQCGFWTPDADPDDPRPVPTHPDPAGVASSSGGGGNSGATNRAYRRRRVDEEGWGGSGGGSGGDEAECAEPRRLSTTWKVEQRRRRALEVAHLERKRRAREGVFGCVGSLFLTLIEAVKGGGPEFGDVLLPSEFFPEDDVDLSPVQIGYARSAAERVGLWEGSDTLSKEDLLNYLRLLGHCPDDMRLIAAMEEMQMQSRNDFTFGEALHIWRNFLDHRDDEMRMLKRAFQFFDRDSSGTISQAEMMETNNELEDPLTAEEINMFFQILDTGGDGLLQYQEFFGIINSDYEELNVNVQLPVNSMRLTSNNHMRSGEDSEEEEGEEEEPMSINHARAVRWQPPTRPLAGDSSKDDLAAQLSLMSVRSSDGNDLCIFEPIEPITPRSHGGISPDMKHTCSGGNRSLGHRSVGFVGVSARDMTVPGVVNEAPR